MKYLEILRKEKSVFKRLILFIITINYFCHLLQFKIQLWTRGRLSNPVMWWSFNQLQSDSQSLGVSLCEYLLLVCWYWHRPPGHLHRQKRIVYRHDPCSGQPISRHVCAGQVMWSLHIRLCISSYGFAGTGIAVLFSETVMHCCFYYSKLARPWLIPSASCSSLSNQTIYSTLG